MNLVQRKGELRRIYPIRLVPSTSLLDGKPCLSVHYEAECPFPWPYVVDELRWLDASTLLGMTFVDRNPLRKLPLPFLLYQT